MDETLADYEEGEDNYVFKVNNNEKFNKAYWTAVQLLLSDLPSTYGTDIEKCYIGDMLEFMKENKDNLSDLTFITE